MQDQHSTQHRGHLISLLPVDLKPTSRSCSGKEEPILLQGTKRGVGRAQTQTSLVTSWHRLKGEGEGLPLPALPPFNTTRVLSVTRAGNFCSSSRTSSPADAKRHGHHHTRSHPVKRLRPSSPLPHPGRWVWEGPQAK